MMTKIIKIIKPELVKTKEKDEDGKQIYDEISYCVICGKKAYVDFVTIENDHYDSFDSDYRFVHHWSTLFTDELEISISREGIALLNGDYVKDDERMEIKRTEWKSLDTIVNLANLFDSIDGDIEEYERQVARSKGDQPTMHFCSKECAKRYIFEKIVKGEPI